MVDDEKYQSLIHWNSTSGFVVVNPDEFAHHVLPQYFKHNNFASFVRQLNMYGFHKVKDFGVGGGDAASSSASASSSPNDPSWEFSHAMFRRGKKHQLHDIKRKVPARSFASIKVDAEQQEGMHAMSGRVGSLEDRHKYLNDSTQSLYDELIACKQQLYVQQQALQQVVGFLQSAFGDGT